jgi:hypothetical protein
MYKSNICYQHGIPKSPTLVVNFNERLVSKTSDGFYEAIENLCPMCLGECDRKTNVAIELLYQATVAKISAMNNIEDKDIYNNYMNQYLLFTDKYKTLIHIDIEERIEKNA